MTSAPPSPGPVRRLPPAPGSPGDDRRRRGRPAFPAPVLVALAALCTASVAANLLWIRAHRSNLPFDIDEAGYLQRAVRNADALHHGGLAGLVTTVRGPDQQAPLLPLVAGLWRALSGSGPYGLLVVQQLFVVGLIVATYAAARRLVTPRWSLLAALTVAAVPAVMDEAHGFRFAIVAAAVTTAALAVQLHADDFGSLPLSLAWGVLVGAAALTRTMVLALLPGLVLSAALQASRRGRRGIAHLVAALAAAAVVALSWYSATWRTVLRYLRDYGYGPDASRYGTARSPLAPGWWTARLDRVVTTDLYAPLAVALALCGLLALIGAAGRRKSGARRAGAARRRIGPAGTVTLYLAVGYLALSTSRNTGSYFELPVLPALIILAVAGAARAGRRLAVAAGASTLLLAAVSVAGNYGALAWAGGPVATSTIGPWHLVLWDDRGTLVRYAGPEAAQLRAWRGPSQEAARVLHGVAAASGRTPVVFFAVQDHLFNTNSVDLEYQLDYGSPLPTGLLRDPLEAHEGLEAQLEDRRLGQPNLVITGDVAPGLAPGFSPTGSRAPTEQALRVDGFEVVDSIALPDGRSMRVWWKLRGPVLGPPTRPAR